MNSDVIAAKSNARVCVTAERRCHGPGSGLLNSDLFCGGQIPGVRSVYLGSFGKYRYNSSMRDENPVLGERGARDVYII